MFVYDGWTFGETLDSTRGSLSVPRMCTHLSLNYEMTDRR
jgi:hypothetical protein